jgi:hypothetical protein
VVTSHLAPYRADRDEAIRVTDVDPSACAWPSTYFAPGRFTASSRIVATGRPIHFLIPPPPSALPWLLLTSWWPRP